MPFLAAWLNASRLLLAQAQPPVAPGPTAPGLWDEVAAILFRLLDLSQLLICCWSCLVIYILMVHGKYRKTAPPYPAVLAFIAAGLGTAFLAGQFNVRLAQTSQFTFFGTTASWQTVISFLLGAGLGEEFFKMGAGVLVIMVLLGLRARLGAPARILGLILVGLAFATMENVLTYSTDLDLLNMFRRAVMPVPMHAAMGVVHGLAVNRALRHGSVLPLFAGYLASALLHTLYDTLGVFVNLGLDRLGVAEVWPDFQLPPEFTAGPFVVLLILWAARQWRRTPEYSPEPDEAELEVEWR